MSDTYAGDTSISSASLRKVIPGIGEKRFAAPLRFDDPTWVSFRLAEILPLRNDVKQKLLEVNDSAVRLSVIAEYLRLQGIGNARS